MNLRDEIAGEFDNCIGFHEGIKVPDYEEGYRAIDFADKILKLFEKRIDERIQDIKQNPFAESDEVIAELEDIKRELKK